MSMRQCPAPLRGSQSQKNLVNAKECADRNERRARVRLASSNSRMSGLPRAEALDSQKGAAQLDVPAPVPCQEPRSLRSAVQGGTPAPSSAAPTQPCGERASTSPCEIVPPSAYFLPITGCRSPRQSPWKGASSFLFLFPVEYVQRP